MKWIPKDNKALIDECKPNGPTFIRGQIFVLENLFCRESWRRASNCGTWIVDAPRT